MREEVLVMERKKRGSALRALCKTKGLTQQHLADLLEVHRSYVQRLEARSWQEYTVRDLKRLAEIFDVRLDAMADLLAGSRKEELRRAALSTPLFHITMKAGAFSSLVPPAASLSIGTLTLPPHATVPGPETPKAHFLFYLVLEGTLLLTFSKEHVLKTGDCACFPGQAPYELYNPNQCRNALALLVASPPPF